MKLFHLKRVSAIIGLIFISIYIWNSIINYKKNNNKNNSLDSIESHIKSDGLVDNRVDLKNNLRLNSGNAFKRFQSIDCLINEEFSIDCIKTLNEDSVYIPFNFINKYFEINGKIIKKKEGKEVFEWSHSYSKVYFPTQTYDSSLSLLWFDNYNVETRDRVMN